MKEIILDVSDLEAPKPLILTAQALRELGDDECLVFQHRMNPKHLFNELSALDMEYTIEVDEPDRFIMKIYKRKK